MIWLKTPSRRRKARESPMWAMASLLPERSMAIVVEPMPASSGSACIAVSRVALASRIERSSRDSAVSAPMPSSSSGARCPTIIELATSPAAWPPMPSASTSRCGPA